MNVDTSKAERDPLISPAVDEELKIPQGFYRTDDGNLAPVNRAALRRVMRKPRRGTGRLSAMRKAPSSFATRLAFRRPDGTIGYVPLDKIPAALEALAALEAGQ